MTTRSIVLIALGGLPLACQGGVDPPIEGESSGTETVGDSSGEVGLQGPPPEIIAAPAVVVRGAHLYLLVDRPLSQLWIELDGEPLQQSELLRADVPGALFLVPTEIAVGPATLSVRLRDDEHAVAEHPLEIVEPRFVDVSAPTGLAQVHDPSGNPQECAESHTGIAFGDYDSDGAPDLFVGHVGRGGQLHRNIGDLDGDGLPDFEDASQASGLSGVDAVTMATFIDLEGDGDLDLFVGRRGENRVFRNQLVQSGNATFVEVSEELGLSAYSQRTMGVAFGDFDGDEDLDLYVVNHAFCFPQTGSEIRAGDHLYRNEGGVFVEQSGMLDLEVMSSVGFSASWVDVERDGDLDLIVINDDVGGPIGNPNALWRNEGPGETPGSWSFSDRSQASGIAQNGVNGMGLALGDVDHDGFVDLAFSNIGDNHLLLNQGDGTFVDVSEATGVQRSSLPWDRPSITWATHLWDHDNDGDLDLYFTGGRIKGTAPIPDAFFDNQGDGTFEDRTWSFGLTDPASGKASALVDLDRDGSWELATTAWGGELRVYRNRSAELAEANHWLDVELEGRGGNREAVGAIVELTTARGMQTCFHTNRPSLGAGGETTCHFGLGEDAEIEGLRIIWPDGSAAEVEPPTVDRRVRFVQSGG